MRYARALLTTTFLVALGASSALAADLVEIADAEEVVEVPGGGTFNLWIGGGYFNAPVANGLGTVGDDVGFFFIDQSDNGAALADLGFNGGFSVWAPASDMTLYAGIDFDLVSATHDDNVDPGDGVFIDTLPIDGAVSPGAIFVTGGGDGVDSTAEISYGRVTGAIGLGMGAGEGGNVAIGLLASGAVLELNSTVSNPVNDANFVSLEETVDMLSGGVMIAGQFDTGVGDGVGLSLGGRAALLYAVADLDASQTASNYGLVEVTDSAEGIAGLLEAQAALNFDVGQGAVFSITGGLGARNDYFSIVNPRSGPGLEADNAASYDPGPASLEQAVIWKATLGVGLTGSF